MTKIAEPAKSAVVNSQMSWREISLIALLGMPLVALMLAVPPIPQDPGYHVLADSRTCFGIPNFGNVMSNAAFLVVGILGVRLLMTRDMAGAAASWAVFFFGTALVAAGSAYYHWTPNNATLVWDRLPMTVAFMALFSALVAEHVRPDLERALLRATLAVGILSVAWWHYTDDLRPYAWVQFAPLLAILFILIVYPGRYTHRAYIVYGLIGYVLAKVAEMSDYGIYDLTAGAVSGHSIKHLLAALGPLAIYLMLRKRQRVS